MKFTGCSLSRPSKVIGCEYIANDSKLMIWSNQPQYVSPSKILIEVSMILVLLQHSVKIL